MGVLDKVRKFKNSRPQFDGQSRTRGIFHDWQDGDNVIRLVGEFLEVRTHFIAPAPKRKERGLCNGEAFAKENENRLPKVINCPDWDVEKEMEKDEKVCPICALHRIAKQALKEDPNSEEKEYFEGIASLTRQRQNLKWNVFDRENPNVTVIDEQGNETKQKGLKIATIGREAWKYIEGIFEQCGFDITDAEEGVDIKVVKGHNGSRTCYSAQVMLEGKGLKVTPFDDEELEIVARPHELKAICGKQTDPTAVRAALHGDYADVLELNSEDADSAPASSPAASEEESANEEEAAAATAAAEDAAPAADDGADDDEDALLGGSEKKK